MLVRLRELAIQSASDTLGNPERGFIEKEYSALKDEIDRISSSTEFNGTRLLVGDATSDHYPQDELVAIEDGKYPLEIQVGKDYYETADGVDEGNPVNIIKIRFDNINTYTSGEGSLEIGKSGEGTMVSGKVEAQKSIAILDTAITKVNDYRAYLGSIQNRLGSTISNLSVQIENVSEAKSRIQDTDFAAETAEYTKSNILQQAGTSVLSSANQQPQVALGLIQNI
jgi:flagellin